MSTSKDYFDAVGAGWDGLREGFFTEHVRDQALAVAAVEQGRTAADLGAGTGFITAGLVARGLHVIAVDQSAAMLEALRNKFPRHDQVDCRTGDAEELPVADESVDCAFANMYLHHVETPLIAVTEMVRILKPGGKVVVTDIDTHDFEFLRTEHHDRWMGFEREDVRRWFREAGLTDVKVDCVGEDCCARSEDGKDAAISIFVASGTKPPTHQLPRLT